MSRAAEGSARQVLLVVLAVLWVATASSVHARPGHRDASDRDGDGVVTERDNCILVANESQLDSDSDGFGNACDLDFNGDGVVDRADAKRLKRIARSRPSIGHPDFDPRLDVNADGKLDRRDERAFRKGRKALERAERKG
ncbi:MAG: thrombospondin type 3 repeat-containing protein, partial [Deltaproteobacteria bacterium]|nr:thrombospondin type 3 repeat-containing protein [Deltaproteobacteria bacterium]